MALKFTKELNVQAIGFTLYIERFNRSAINKGFFLFFMAETIYKAEFY